MIEICDNQKCTGCSACYNACPKGAISMVSDKKGFLYPEIDAQTCVECKICQRVCPQNQVPSLSEPLKVLAGLAKNDVLREQSSSGGIFSLLAQQIIERGGVVCGAGFDDDWNVVHMCAETQAELDKLRGSKYVQSGIGTIYQDIANFLKQGKWVLFSGTPCQVDGLKHYLRKPAEKLITVDILCHGTPSPDVFRRYLDSAIAESHCDISNIAFRVKDPGWKAYTLKINFENGTQQTCGQRECYMSGFLQNLYLRESCYQCVYAQTERAGDITLGDYWGYQETSPDHIEDDDRGISMIMLNTEKGRLLFEKVRKLAAFTIRSEENAASENPILLHPSTRSKHYAEFWTDYGKMEWPELCKKYFPVCPPSPDSISPEDRLYYSIPYQKRHRRHLIHCAKVRLINVLKHR